MTTLLGVAAAPAVFGVLDLAERWAISKRAVASWVRRDGFPASTVVGANTHIWSIEDIKAWEAQQVEAGLPLPGQRPRGREPRGGR